MDLPNPPEEPEVKNIIDKLANFVARNGNAFEKMTKDKQKNNPKFSFLFGGQHYNYYQYRLTTEQQILNKQRSIPPQVAQETIVQQSLQNAPWQQPQGNFGGFPQGPPPPIQQGMPPRHMQPIPPWQQQRPPAPWQQPPPRIDGPRGMPPRPQMHPPSRMPMGPGSSLSDNPDQAEVVKSEDALEKEEQEVEAKVKQSEENLQRQYDALMAQEKEQVEAAIQKEQNLHRRELASNNNVSLEDFDDLLQPIINSCTKDSIANGKSWILNHGSDEKCRVIAQQLLYRISEAKLAMKKQAGDDKKLFDTQLHLIYLINDVLHHASRKNLTGLSSAIESVIVPIFSITHSSTNEQNRQRLAKLLGLWNKFNYFSSNTMQELADPEKALADYEKEIDDKYSYVVKEIQSSIQSQYEQFQTQHEEYAKHIQHEMEEKRKEFEKQKQQHQQSTPGSQDTDPGSRIERMEADERREYRNPPFFDPGRRNNDNMSETAPPWSDRYEDGDGDGYYDNFNQGSRPPRESNFDRRRSQNNFGPRPPPPDWRNEPMSDRPDWDQDREPGNWHQDAPPDRFDERNPNWGNRRGPPPGPSGPGGMMGTPDESPLIPKAPYYDLPAGLMAPLVNLEDMDYKELDPSLIRLPPPVPPSERLVAAVEAFYAPPSHERPRNPDGWEHNGLFEFFRAKVRAKRRADQGRRDSRSRSHERRSYSRDRSYSRSRSRSSSRSRSRSSRSRSRSNSRSPGRGRRTTSPSFGPAYYQHNVDPNSKIEDHNRGAQMMRKMGWGGAGLGSAEQGIQDPVKASDVRDKYDQFKGLGMDMNDPYETYRKNRSYGYGPRARGREAKMD